MRPDHRFRFCRVATAFGIGVLLFCIAWEMVGAIEEAHAESVRAERREAFRSYLESHREEFDALLREASLAHFVHWDREWGGSYRAWDGETAVVREASPALLERLEALGVDRLLHDPEHPSRSWMLRVRLDAAGVELRGSPSAAGTSTWRPAGANSEAGAPATWTLDESWLRRF